MRAIADQRSALLGALAPVEGEAWAAPTVCTGWSAKDVLSHMVEGELNVGRVYRGEQRALGPVDPNEGVARWSPLPGVAVRAAFWQHGTATQRALDAMTDETWGAPIEAFGCRRVAQLARLHLFDLCVHGHDITDALEMPPLWGPHLGFLVEFVARAAPATFARLGVAPEGSLAVAPAGLERTWVLDGTQGSWSVRAEPGDGASATIEPSAEDLVMATTGRTPVPDVLDRTPVEGDAAYAAGILAGWQVLRR